MSNLDFKLSADEIETFHRKGYIGPFTLFSAEEMNNILKSLRLKLLNTKSAIYYEQQKGQSTLLGYDRHLDIPFLAELIGKKEIVDRLISILGKNILCWRTELFPKYPGDEGTDWHQSNTFRAVTGDKKPQIEWPDDTGFGGSITVWIAFTEANVDNGCLQFIPGTHTTMYYDETKIMHFDKDQINQIEKNGTKRGFFGYDFRQLQFDPNWKPDESKAESMIMRPGQFIIFWSSLMHSSHDHKGLTKEMRLGFSARYVPTCVKIYPYSDQLDEFGGKASLEKHKSVLVSGIDEFGHNNI